MTAKVRFVFQYPETYGTEGDMLDSGPIDEVAAAAERAGFDAFSLTEHPAPGARWLASGGHQSLDPLVALAFAAAATARIRLLTLLVVAPYRNPLLLAKAAATVDKLSGGRLILGLGAGYQKTEFFALGVDMEERNVLFDEVLDVLPMHWSGEPFSYRGRHFDARDVIAMPRPVQNPIPIWIGGNSKLSRHRVAERAQGWMPMISSAELSAATRTRTISSVEELGVLIGEMQETTEGAGRRPVDVLCPYHDPSLRAPAKDADLQLERLAEIEKAGANWITVSTGAVSRSGTLDFLEAFGSTYLQEQHPTISLNR